MRGAKDVYGGEDIIGRVDGRGGGHMEEEKYHSVGPWRSYGPLEGTLGDFFVGTSPPRTAAMGKWKLSTMGWGRVCCRYIIKTFLQDVNW